MKLYRRILAACLASFFCLPCLSAQGQAPRSPAWERLSNARGKEVQVRLSGGKSRQGRLSDVTDEGIHLRSGSDEFSLARNEVIQVYELRKKARKRSALIGTAVGGGAGAIIGAASSSSCGFEFGAPCHRVRGAAVGAVAGAAVGALTGALLGGGQKKVLIYDGGARK